MDRFHDSCEDSEIGDDPSPSTNLLAPVLGLIGIGVLVCAIWLFGPSLGAGDDNLSRCAAMADQHARLLCYDQLAGPRAPMKGALAPVGHQPHERLQ